MTYADTISWQVSVSSPQALAIGLYVRAAAGLAAAHPWLPPISPAVPAVRAGTEVAVPQWERWWDFAVHQPKALWEPPEYDVLGSELAVRVPRPPILRDGNRLRPPFDDLAGSPELHRHVARHFMDAVRWCNRRTDPARQRTGSGALLETHLVAELARDAGHAATAFALRVSCIPVEGATMWRLADDHVLVSEALLADTEAYRSRLAVVVRSLL